MYSTYMEIILLFFCLAQIKGFVLPVTEMEAPDAVEFEDDSFNYDGRIIGGVPASINNFPYQVSLQYKGEHICGASIIQPNLIITAAYCVEEPVLAEDYIVRAGSAYHRHGGELIGVRRIIRHEDYSPGTLNNDIALVMLTEDLKYSDRIQPIKLAKPDDAVPRTRLTVSGWGLTTETGSASPMLRFVTVRLIQPRICIENYKNIVTITNEMICAGLPNGGKDSCQGDSGGPLVSGTGDAQKLYGVVSFGVGCGLKDYPGVYAKIAAFRPWLNSRMAEVKKSV